MIVGVDEVGRGSLAGPVCVAAVAWPDDAHVEGLADSKVLTPAKRVALAAKIRLQAADIGIGWISAALIDEFGLSEALHRAARQAVSQLRVADPTIIVDGRDAMLRDIKATYVIKADAKVPAVSAASIIAKVARDTYMLALHTQFADYQFAQHVGYGTALHRSLIAKFGPCALHRMSFAPLKGLAQ